MVLFDDWLVEMMVLSFCTWVPLLKSPLDVVGEDEPNSPGFNAVFTPNKLADWPELVPNKPPDWLVAVKVLVIPVIPVVCLVELALLPKTLPVTPETLLCPNTPDWLLVLPVPNRPDRLELSETVENPLDWRRGLPPPKLPPNPPFDWPKDPPLPNIPPPVFVCWKMDVPDSMASELGSLVCCLISCCLGK